MLEEAQHEEGVTLAVRVAHDHDQQLPGGQKLSREFGGDLQLRDPLDEPSAPADQRKVGSSVTAALRMQ